MGNLSAKFNLVSICCKASVAVKPDPHFYHSDQEAQITMWYECMECHQPCDVEEVENEKIR